MRVCVLGAGHVGLVTAATLAKAGHTVAAYDDNSDVRAALAGGKVHFFEDGLEELVSSGVSSGQLTFPQSPHQALSDSEIVFICVGTPGRPDGATSMKAVEGAAQMVAQHAPSSAVVVEKSTVPVHTAERVAETLQRATGKSWTVVSNPEFLREGSAVADSLKPDRILVGATDPRGHELMSQLYEQFKSDECTYIETDLATAELSKHACNAFLALKISYVNSLARICEATGADVAVIAQVMGADRRIGGEFLKAGIGYGGFCLPKDVAAFVAQAESLGQDFGILKEIVKANDSACRNLFDKITKELWNVDGKTIAILGLAFKPETDDIREAPALKLAEMLLRAGAEVRGHDPKAGDAAAAEVPGLKVHDDPYSAAEGAQCVIIATEWSDYSALDLERLKSVLARPLIFDGRNIFNPAEMAEAGFKYVPTGRPAVNP